MVFSATAGHPRLAHECLAGRAASLRVARPKTGTFPATVPTSADGAPAAAPAKQAIAPRSRRPITICMPAWAALQWACPHPPPIDWAERCNRIGWGSSSRTWLYKNPHANAAISKVPINTFSTPFGTRTNLMRHSSAAWFDRNGAK